MLTLTLLLSRSCSRAHSAGAAVDASLYAFLVLHRVGTVWHAPAVASGGALHRHTLTLTLALTFRLTLTLTLTSGLRSPIDSGAGDWGPGTGQKRFRPSPGRRPPTATN